MSTLITTNLSSPTNNNSVKPLLPQKSTPSPFNNNNNTNGNGKSKKKRKRISKSERKRRKRARELQEIKEKLKLEDDGVKGEPPKPKLEIKGEKEQTKHNDISMGKKKLNQQEPKSMKINPNNSKHDKKNDKVQLLNTENDGDNNQNGALDKKEVKNSLALSNITVDTDNLLEFVYPRSKQKYDHVMKTYTHSKLRHNFGEGKNNTYGENGNQMNDNYSEKKQKAISMGVADESIEDILSSNKKKEKGMEDSDKMTHQKEEEKAKSSSSSEDEESDTNSDNDDNNHSDKASISKQTMDSNKNDDNDESISKSRTNKENHNSSTNFPNQQVESQSNNKEKLVPSKEVNSNNEDKAKLQFLDTSVNDKSNSIIEMNNDTSQSIISLGRKRSMSEDSSNDNSLMKSKLSGISVEMAVKDKFGRRPRSNSTDGELNLPRRGLCDEQKVMGFHKWDMDKFHPVPPRGFHNLGNTCFLNATLQCLAHLPTFCQCVANIDPSQHKSSNMNGKKKKLSNGQLITLALRALLHNVHGLNNNGNTPKQSPISPKTIVNSISLIDGSNRGYKFRPGRQEDAHEFLVHLLDAMNDGELKAAGINQKKSGWRDRLPIPRLDETTFVHRMFGGYLRSQVCCTKCDYKSNTYDPFLDLSLEVSNKKVNCVYSALKEYTRRETLDAANKWKCSGCKRRVCATKQLTCFRPPLSLCIQLKRFSFGSGMGGYMHHQFGYSHFAGKGMGMRQGGSKIQKPIDFPAELKLPLSDGRKCEYQLSGVVIHVGHSATSGHYTAFVRRQMKEGSKWFHMDDSFVEPVKEKTVLRQRDAYVLFYCRKEVKLNLPNPPSIFATVEEAKKSEMAKKMRMRAAEVDNGAQNLVDEEGNKPQNVQEEVHTTNAEPTNDEKSTQPSDMESLEESSSTAPQQSDNNEPKKNKISQGQGSKPKKKLLTLNQGSKRGSVQVLVGKLRRKKKTWKPSYVQGNNRENVLLGNTNVSKWGDEDQINDSLLRETVSKELKQEQKNRKRKMYLDGWDAGLDKGRMKKVKEKRPQESYQQVAPNQNQFHRLQHSLTLMKRRGGKHSQKKGRMRK